MKKAFAFLIFSAAVVVANAQSPGIQWQKNFGGSGNDAATSIQQTADGGYIVAGSSNSVDSEVTGAHGSDDFWVIKLSSSGILEWEKSLGGGMDDDAHYIRQTFDGGYIIAGQTISGLSGGTGIAGYDGDVSGNHGLYDYWIVKLNASGAIQWEKCYGGYSLFYNGEGANAIRQTTDGGYIVAGQASAVPGNHGEYDYWVLKLNDTGGVQWQQSLGGTGTDIANSVQQTTDGGYIVAGYSNSNDSDVTGNHGGNDYWIVKLNAAGSIAWEKSYGGSGNDEANSIQQTIDGGYIVAGSTESGDGDVTGFHGGDDYWVLKLNSAGGIQWEKALGGHYNEFASAIQQTSDSGYIVAGSTFLSGDGDVAGSGYHNNFDFWTVKLNDAGNIQWTKCLGGYGNDNANAIQQTSDGGFVVAGSSSSTDGDVTANFGGNDFWVVKLTPGAVITGVPAVCSGSVTLLGDTSVGGVWSSSNTGIATVSTGSGVVTGVAAGTVTISYTVSGNSATITVTVSSLPSAGDITGLPSLCIGSSITLADSVTGGTWSATNGNATIAASSVTGIIEGIDTIRYSVTNGCGTTTATKAITVNSLPSPGAVTGPSGVCAGAGIILAESTTGGTWSASNGNATVVVGSVSGIVAGTDTIRYSVTNACGTVDATKTITVNLLPGAGAVTGLSSVCVASAITLTDGATGGVWSSSNAAATVTGGVVTGVAAGVDTVSYLVTNTCGTAAASKIVTVNPLASAGTIDGPSSVCIASAITLTDSVPGGSWGGSNSCAAVSGGVVNGVATGFDTISYTVTNTCGMAIAIKTITINSLPSVPVISGITSVCADSAITLTVAVSGGVWSSGNISATVAGGLVTGVSAGTDTINYAITNICGTAVAGKMITVNPLPVAGTISGDADVCMGSVILLAESVTTGIWSSSNTSAVVSDGAVAGVASGIATISYSVTNECGTVAAIKNVIISVAPSAGTITGASTVCLDSTTSLTDSAPGGVWSSVNPFAIVDTMGIVTGVSSGAAAIIYAVSNACGTEEAVFPVEVFSCIPTAISTASYNTAILQVYPNPNDGAFALTISTGNNEAARVIITNIVGEEVKESMIPANKETGITLHVPPGIYFLSAVTKDQVFTSKIIIE